ncbi:MAG TPA: copper resistance protein NlpE, partial [Empedobacter falsenii]|nr:copper resistance protein NlpE [Empedobacter falsenii]
QGQFEWTADNNAIFLDTKDKNRYFYKVGENKLIVLSQEGEELDGPLANNYILTKK